MTSIAGDDKRGRRLYAWGLRALLILATLGGVNVAVARPANLIGSLWLTEAVVVDDARLADSVARTLASLPENVLVGFFASMQLHVTSKAAPARLPACVGLPRFGHRWGMVRWFAAGERQPTVAGQVQVAAEQLPLLASIVACEALAAGVHAAPPWRVDPRLDQTLVEAWLRQLAEPAHHTTLRHYENSPLGAMVELGVGQVAAWQVAKMPGPSESQASESQASESQASESQAHGSRLSASGAPLSLENSFFGLGPLPAAAREALAAEAHDALLRLWLHSAAHALGSVGTGLDAAFGDYLAAPSWQWKRVGSAPGRLPSGAVSFVGQPQMRRLAGRWVSVRIAQPTQDASDLPSKARLSVRNLGGGLGSVYRLDPDPDADSDADGDGVVDADDACGNTGPLHGHPRVARQQDRPADGAYLIDGPAAARRGCAGGQERDSERLAAGGSYYRWRQDADADGVTDGWDNCSNTPAGMRVWTQSDLSGIVSGDGGRHRYLGCATGQQRDRVNASRVAPGG